MKLTLFSLLLTLSLLSSTATSVEVTTGNILNNSTFGTGTQYSETGWDVTGYDNHHDDLGSGSINNTPGGSFAAGVDSEISQSVTLSTDAQMNQKEIQNGFSSTAGADVWFWNNYNNTVTLEQKITGSDGSVTTQTRNIPTSNCGFSNCNQYNNYTDTHIQGANTQTDFNIKVTIKNQGVGYTSGHLGPDVDDVTLSITYTDIDLIDEDAQDAIEDIEENIPDIEDDFTWEDDFYFEEEDYAWEDDFYFEEDFSMDWEDDFYFEEDFDVDWEEFDMDMEEFEITEEFNMEMPEEFEMMEEFEEFDMTDMPTDAFEDMYMEEFEEFETVEDAFSAFEEEFEDMEMPEEMEIVEEFEDMPEEMEMEEMEEEFIEMEMEEEPTEMVMEEEEETIDMEMETEEDVAEMDDEPEEMEVAKDEPMEEPKEDEESSESAEETVEKEPESEESAPKTVEDEKESMAETDVADEGGIETKNIEVSKEIKVGKVDVGEIKITVNPKEIFKEVVTLDNYSNRDFYKDKGLDYAVNDDFFDQLSMIEYSKEIYKGVTLVAYIQSDPVEVYRQELEELAIQKAGIMIELKLLRGE